MDRVKWFRARAARDRAKEEVEILQQEFLRTIRSFQKISTVWHEIAGREDKGRAAYGYQQSVMYGSLAKNCEDSYAKVVLG